MAFFKVTFSLLLLTFLSATLSLAHPGFNFGWGSGPFGGGSNGLLPQFYQFSCPQADDIVIHPYRLGYVDNIYLRNPFHESIPVKISRRTYNWGCKVCDIQAKTIQSKRKQPTRPNLGEKLLPRPEISVSKNRW
ncbi:hypothetical protein Dsin_003562 [Dipteronia sinensis]|uniref:Uncharacterized protein n=1 Tax=Dipteronia sinensis TaxID=43782 RepID=A0AAE0EKG4_9ROSI|nr:hypothetical protein Dsin_003562 [Dipteronia sinensis]